MSAHVSDDEPFLSLWRALLPKSIKGYPWGIGIAPTRNFESRPGTLNMRFSYLAALVACVPTLVKAAGTGNPFEGSTTFLTPSYVAEVQAAVAKLV